MKKILATLMVLFILSTVLCAMVVPVSATGDFKVTVCGLSKDGLVWALGIYNDCEDAWNDAIYYATHLDEAWNSAERYETPAEAVEGNTFVRIIVDFYDDWVADSNGSFGTGEGFKDGAIYIPADAKITVDFGGHSVKLGVSGEPMGAKAMYIEAGADVTLSRGSVIGDVYAASSAKVSIENVYVAGSTKSNTAAARSASIFSEGSQTSLIVILALVASIASVSSMFMIVAYNKKKEGSLSVGGVDDDE